MLQYAEATVKHVEPTIGIVTALPEESAAVRMVLNGLVKSPAMFGDPNTYHTGTLPSTDKHLPHGVVLGLMTRDGTTDAAAMCVSMARSFPQLRIIVMCGIAGAVPAPQSPSKHVRLGDVVVADGIVVDYGHKRIVDGDSQLRRPISVTSDRLVAADRELAVQAHLGRSGWYEAALSLGPLPADFSRPPDSSDILTKAGDRILHPDLALSGHKPSVPKVHRGPIGSANVLLRDEKLRDQLAAKYGIIAVEMEGSGVAAGARIQDVSWFMVRGAADYCANATKNDLWHGYAAWVAAAYTRALLGQCHPLGETKPVNKRVPMPRGEDLTALVDTLNSITILRDDYQRRVIIGGLPREIDVPGSTHGRLHLISMIDACAAHEDGRQILLDALKLALGPSSSDYRKVEDAFDNHW